MKVAIDAGPLYGHRTGVGVAAVGMIDALGRHADVELSPYLISGRATPQPGHRRLPMPGIVASHVWSRSDRPLADRWLGDVDLVHGTNYVAPPSRRPSIVSVYDCWFLRHTDAATPIVRRAGRTLRRAVERGAWVHTTSHATADEARALLDTERVEVVLLGPPDADPAPAQTPAGLTELAGRRFVVAIGTEERRKDLPLLLTAFEHIAADLTDVALVLAGAPGDDADRVTAAIEELPEPIRARVHRLGPVDAPSKAWLLRHATVLAYPSLDEGFGFPILEANAAGTPVVAMAVGSIPEVAGEAAVLVDDPERRPTEFATALANTLDGGRLGLIEAGYRNLRRFDWAVTADQLVGLYRRALEAA
jgi:glycosyltransferase involved in cell wall biosynthesis